MGTKGNIIAPVEDEWRLIYVGYDAYPSGLGRTLFKHYQNPSKIAELVSLGDCSSVGRDQCAPETTAYHRDRGEDWDDMRYRVFPSLAEAKAATRESYAYAYAWDGESWWIETRAGGWEKFTGEETD